MATRKRLKTNEARLVMQSVLGEVSPPVGRNEWRVGVDGKPSILPGVGGISYNVVVGDSAIDWVADHVEPGVSVRTKETAENNALNVLSCVGNTAHVVSGDAKGAKGTVTGKHGGIEHVLIDFAADVMEKLVVGDKVQVRAVGVGLAIDGLEDVALVNMDPALLHAMAPVVADDRLALKVSHRLPACIMGSGIGKSHTYSGDYDTQLFDPVIVEEYGLDSLRLGDIVAIENADHTYGRIYRTGAVTIGVVVHSCCKTAGHGPGVTTLMSSSTGKIDVEIDRKANIADLLKIGRQRPAARKGK